MVPPEGWRLFLEAGRGQVLDLLLSISLTTQTARGLWEGMGDLVRASPESGGSVHLRSSLGGR